MPYAQVPDHVILDVTLTHLQRRLYEFLDLKAGSRGYWDDSLVAIAGAMGASRRHLGDAMRALVERGLVTREALGHWRSRFVVVAPLGTPPQPPPGPPSKADEIRWQVWERDDFRCRACGSRRALTIDHITPRSAGGGDEITNLQTLCLPCNSRKGARP